jgi:ABC-2 type transport system ATP-binding protein
MASVEEICDEICLINKAHKILDGNLVEIKQRFKQHIYSMDLHSPQAISFFPANFTVLEQKADENIQHYLVKVMDGGSANSLLQFVMEHGEVLAFNEVLPSMNDIFIQQVEHYNQEHQS